MLEVTGSGFDRGAAMGIVSPKRRDPRSPMDDFFKILRKERERIERREMEAIKRKPKEERTFSEKVKLAYYEMEQVLKDLPDPVVYVA